MASKEFLEHRAVVIQYVTDEMIDQGATRAEAITTTTCINFFGNEDVENLYRCIKSDFPPEVIRSIVAHDFNGLANQDEYFLPKSSQFGRKNALSH